MSASLAYDPRDEQIACLKTELASFKAWKVDYQIAHARFKLELKASEQRSRQRREEGQAFDDARYQRLQLESMQHLQRAITAELDNESLKSQLVIERRGHAAAWASMRESGT